MSHLIRLLAFILLCPALAISQAAPEKKSVEDREKLEKEAVAFLRETLADVNGMRSLENRISFASELAGLMWFHDEREARAMYAGVIGDFRDLLAGYDAQMNAVGLTPEDIEGRPSYSFMVDPTDKARLLRRFQTAMGVRQQIATSMAEHDADLAFGFYYDSMAAISNPALREKLDGSNSYFEFQLLDKLADDSAAKAAKYGARSLTKGLRSQHIDLLKKIYAKDVEKAVEFGSALLSRLKVEKPSEYDFVTFALLEFGSENYDASRKQGGKRPVYGQPELREIAEILAQSALNRNEAEGVSALGYANIIQKYQPARAAQIRTKFKSSANTYRTYSSAMNSNVSANASANTNYYGDPGSSNSNTTVAREREERERAERQAVEDVQNLATKQLPKEERQRIIGQARKIIMQTPGRDKKIASLSMLAAQVSKTGDMELAAEIMRDAERLVNPVPKNYQDFILTWMLATGYASADPEKAFPLLEETISRANDTLAAFVKVGEFMDVAEEMIQDGEVQVGAFGGQMVRGLTGELSMADATIQLLAKADFGKTKALTNRFDRAEIRVLAKMMVLRAVLTPEATAKSGDGLPVAPNK